MEISAGTLTNMNPELNISSVLQILNSLGLDQAVLNESDDQDAPIEDFEKILFQVLQQNMTAFLQTVQQRNAPDSTAEENLLAVLEKLTREDRTAHSEMLSGLTLSVLTANSNSPVDDEGNLLEETIPGSKEKTEVNDIYNHDMKGDALKKDQTAFLKEIETLSSKTIGLSADKNINQEDITPGLNAEHEAMELPDQKVTTLPKETPNHAKPADLTTENKGLGGMQDRTAASTGIAADSFNKVSDAPEWQRLAAKTSGATNLTEDQKHILPDPGNEQKRIMIDGENPQTQRQNVEGRSGQKPLWADSQGSSSTQLKNVDQQLVAERIAGENPSAKPVVFFKEMVRDNPPVRNLFNGKTAEEEDLSNDSRRIEQGQEVKKSSARPDIVHADKKLSFLLNESQKQDMTGKAGVPVSEIAGVIDKVKTDPRNKSVSGEKNYESNLFNSLTSSGLHSAKTAASDVPSTQIIERIVAQFTEMMASEGGRVKMTLTPPSLGTLEMDVMIRNGAVRVMLIADNKEVQQILSGNLDSLKGSLQNQGLVIERCDVMMHDRREQYSQGFNQQQAFNQEQTSRHHYDEVNGSIQDKEEMIPLKIKPVSPFTGPAGKISLFV